MSNYSGKLATSHPTVYVDLPILTTLTFNFDLYIMTSKNNKL